MFCHQPLKKTESINLPHQNSTSSANPLTNPHTKSETLTQKINDLNLPKKFRPIFNSINNRKKSPKKVQNNLHSARPRRNRAIYQIRKDAWAKNDKRNRSLNQGGNSVKTPLISFAAKQERSLCLNRSKNKYSFSKEIEPNLKMNSEESEFSLKKSNPLMASEFVRKKILERQRKLVKTQNEILDGNSLVQKIGKGNFDLLAKKHWKTESNLDNVKMKKNQSKLESSGTDCLVSESTVSNMEEMSKNFMFIFDKGKVKYQQSSPPECKGSLIEANQAQKIDENKENLSFLENLGKKNLLKKLTKTDFLQLRNCRFR